MTRSAARRLPITVGLGPGEDIAAFVAGLAEANHVSFTALTGLSRRARLWESPPEALLTHLEGLTGITESRLRQATITAAYTHAHLHHPRTGRRWSGQPATCPGCGIIPVAARLNLVATCPTCGSLLTDRLDPHPPQPPQGLINTQSEVLATLSGDYVEGSMRISRLPELIPVLEPAIRATWPPLLDGETAQWRSRTMHFLDQALRADYPVARPPSVLGTLIALAWPSTLNGPLARDFRDACAVMADRFYRDHGDLPARPTPHRATAGIYALLRDLNLRPEHVPTIIRRVDEPLVLSRHLRPTRVADALALTILASHAHGPPMTLKHARKHHAAGTTDLVGRLATNTLNDPNAHHHLAAQAQHLHDQGLRDLARARAEFRRLATLPREAVPGFGGTTGDSVDRQLAAAWVWLDATAGSPTGGPYPILPVERLLEFDIGLDPETKLHLRTWWQTQLAIVEDMVAGEVAADIGAGSSDRYAG